MKNAKKRKIEKMTILNVPQDVIGYILGPFIGITELNRLRFSHSWFNNALTGGLFCKHFLLTRFGECKLDFKGDKCYVAGPRLIELQKFFLNCSNINDLLECGTAKVYPTTLKFDWEKVMKCAVSYFWVVNKFSYINVEEYSPSSPEYSPSSPEYSPSSPVYRPSSPEYWNYLNEWEDGPIKKVKTKKKGKMRIPFVPFIPFYKDFIPFGGCVPVRKDVIKWFNIEISRFTVFAYPKHIVHFFGTYDRENHEQVGKGNVMVLTEDSEDSSDGVFVGSKDYPIIIDNKL